MALPSGPTRQDQGRLVTRLRVQAGTAAQLGSPLYHHLFEGVAADVARDGPCWTVLCEFAHEPDSLALPLRFMAAVHRLVLRRRAPALALYYPSVGGQADHAVVEQSGPGPIGVRQSAVWESFLAVVEDHRGALTDLTALPCQTNEVGRSAALGAAIAWLAGHHDLPVNHYEIGTSAGLNLRWDHFRYGTADQRVTWGPEGSPVDLTGLWIDPPTLPPEVEVATRQGCDPGLLDPGSAADRETLTAAVWADMRSRHERLKGALALARTVPAITGRTGAGDWLSQHLPSRPAGLSVVAHSVVWRYIPDDERTRIISILHEVGAAASESDPLVWLRLEPRPPAMVYDGYPYPILATTWPGGQTRELGQAQAHGQEVRWQR